MPREITLDDSDVEILEFVFDDDMIETLCSEFEEGKVKELVEKLNIEFAEDIFPAEEDS